MSTMTIKIQGPQLLEVCSVLFEDFRQEVTLGRSSRCDVRLPLPTISGHHLTFRKQGAIWEVSDMGSTNGTIVDGQPLTPGTFAPLKHGAMLQILETSIQVDMRGSEGFTIGDADGMTQEMIRGILQKQGDDDIAFIEVIRGESYRGQKFPLYDELKEVFVGAQSGALIQLRAAGAPSKAFTITRHGDGFAIAPQPGVDLSLNHQTITSAALLSHGDRIVAGEIEVLFRDPLEGYWDDLDGLAIADTAHGNHAALAPLDAASATRPEAPAEDEDREVLVQPDAPATEPTRDLLQQDEHGGGEGEEKDARGVEVGEEEQVGKKKRGVGALEVVVGGMIVLVLLACVGLIVLTMSGG
ncbi:MAG: FHA domain-containing protein [Myxococcota bacterium]|nr:FHA domain-containing protein [Myxococcota bacterium]